MDLKLLSIPEMGVEGVPIAELLKGSAGECIRDPETHMLQDPMNWGAISDEVCNIKTYDDPKLRSKNFYLTFLKRLRDAGILSWTQRPRGRVGSFVVKKKPKEINGKMVDRQRLILDCRRVNTLFRAPPITELGSLPALGDLSIPVGQQLFISGGDIKDCFYACGLPSSLRDYFCFSFDISIDEARDIFGADFLANSADSFLERGTISPCLDVLPMGYSWSFYLVQSLHVQACLESSGNPSNSVTLDARPPPQLMSGSSLSMPYCDNTHVLSMDSDIAHHDHISRRSWRIGDSLCMRNKGPLPSSPLLGVS